MDFMASTIVGIIALILMLVFGFIVNHQMNK